MKNIEDVKKELEFEFLIHKPNKEHMEVPMESPMCKAYLEIIKVKNEAEKALKAIPEYQAREEALEAKEKANRAVEATPEFKKYWKAKETTEEAWKANEAWEKARKAIDKKGAYWKTPEYKAWEKADKVEYKLYMALVRTPECLAQNEAYNAYSKAYKKSRDEVEKVFKTMPTKFMGKELSEYMINEYIGEV